MKHRLRQPITLVAAVLALVALLSAAAVGLPGEAGPSTTTSAASQTAFQRGSAARARRAFERQASVDLRARQVTFLTSVSNQRRADMLRKIAALRAIAAQRAAAARAHAPTAKHTGAAINTPGNGRCGGNLPPCCVMNRESGGNIHAQNPSSSASGKWQFIDSTWNGYGGYAHASDAPESVQDAKAAQLWSGGSGSGHWGGGC
jgi:hypothetical protein